MFNCGCSELTAVEFWSVGMSRMTICHEAGTLRLSCVVDSCFLHREDPSSNVCTTATSSYAGRSAQLRRSSLQVASPSCAWPGYGRQHVRPVRYPQKMHPLHTSWRSSCYELEPQRRAATDAATATTNRLMQLPASAAVRLAGAGIASRRVQRPVRPRERRVWDALNGWHPAVRLDDASTARPTRWKLPSPPASVSRLCHCLSASEANAVAGGTRQARAQAGAGAGARARGHSGRCCAGGNEAEAVTSNGSSSPCSAAHPTPGLPLPASPSSSPHASASGSGRECVRVWGVELPLQSLAAWALVAASAWLLRPFAGVRRGPGKRGGERGGEGMQADVSSAALTTRHMSLGRQGTHTRVVLCRPPYKHACAAHT